MFGVDTSDTDFDTVEETGGAKSNPYTPAGSNAPVTLSANQSGIQAHNTTSSGYVKNGITGGSHNHVPDTSNSYFWVYRYTGGNTHGALDSGTSAGVSYDLRGGTSSTAHNHDLPNHTHSISAASAKEAHNHSFTGTQANISTVQPYITTYMWKRVS